MPTNFSTQPLRNVILDDAVRQMTGQQAFEERRDDPEAMKMFWRMANRTLSEGDLRALNNMRNPAQGIELYLWNRRAPGTGNAYVSQGAGSRTVATVIPQLFDPVEEGLDMSFVNERIRQYGSEGADKREIIRRAYTDHLAKELPEIWRNIYTRINAQYLAYLEQEKWVLTGTLDKGGQYNTVVTDAKNITAGENPLDIFKKIRVEAQKNNFLGLGRPEILGSPELSLVFDEYAARGANNETNQIQFLNYFTPYFDNQVANANLSTFYMVANGGVFGYQYSIPWGAHPDAQGGAVTKGEHSWSNITIGGSDTLMFNGLPELDLSVKTFGSESDTSATYTNVPEATIDIVDRWSFVARCGAGKAYDQDANVSPIIKYIQL